MQCEESLSPLTTFVELVNCIVVNDNNFDENCMYQYYNNNAQAATCIGEAIRQYEFVVLMLKALIRENHHKSITENIIVDLIKYIQKAEFTKDLFYTLESSWKFPSSEYFLKTLKYDLVQFNVQNNTYVLLLKCMNFHERDVLHSMEVAFYFFSSCIDREVSLSPQIKWKFFGNPYISITWMLFIPVYKKDSEFRRQLVNEFWNTHYNNETDWKPPCTKGNFLMEYMRKLTGFKKSTIGTSAKKKLQRFISRSSSFFEIDDTIFAKFSEDKDQCKKWGIFSFMSVGVVFLLLFIIWLYIHFYH